MMEIRRRYELFCLLKCLAALRSASACSSRADSANSSLDLLRLNSVLSRQHAVFIACTALFEQRQGFPLTRDIEKSKTRAQVLQTHHDSDLRAMLKCAQQSSWHGLHACHKKGSIFLRQRTTVPCRECL